MPIDPSLITDTLSRWQSPQFTMPDPLAQYAKIQALKNGIMQQQCDASDALDLQQKQTLLNDQQKFSQILADPDVAGDVGKALPRLGAAGVSANTIQSATKAYQENQTSIANHQKLVADADKANDEVAKSQADVVSDMLQSAKDDGSTASSLVGHANALKSMNPALAPKIDAFVGQVLNSANPDAMAKQVIESGINQATMAKKSTASQQSAAAQKDAAEAAKTEFQNTLMKTALAGGAGVGENLIQQRFAGNPAAAAKALFAWRQNLSTGDLKAANDEVNKIYQNEIGAASQIASETPAKVAQGRAMIPVEAATAAATSRATLPVEEAKALYQNALGQGDKATEAYASTISDSRQTAAAGSTIQKVITLAQGNNATAGAQLKALIPELTNAMQNIKRPGNAQSSQISSVLENAIGEIKSGAGLSPVTKKAISDIRPYVDAVVNGAVVNANGQIDATNTAYGKKFAHETLPVQYHQNPKTGQTIVSRDGGITWTDTKTGESVQ